MGVAIASRHVDMVSTKNLMISHKLLMSCIAKIAGIVSKNVPTCVYPFGIRFRFEQNLFI
jgi:hypothetical protein